MRFFVFVDTPYYPYVDDVIEADSLTEAREQVAATLSAGDTETVVYLVPEESVTVVGPAEGPKTEPKGLLKLLQEQNRLGAQLIDAKNSDWSFVSVEPGTIRKAEE